MVAATLWPVGRPLSGLQVYENMRAVDYLLTRKEVDGERLGITGTSGGGNQTVCGRVGRTVQGGGAGVFGGQLPGVPRRGVLHVRGGARRVAVHGGMGRAKPHGAARADGHQCDARWHPVFSRRGEEIAGVDTADLCAARQTEIVEAPAGGIEA